MSTSFLYSSLAASVLFLAACSSSPSDLPAAACGDGQVLQVGFYAFFAPVSYSADPDSKHGRVRRASRVRSGFADRLRGHGRRGIVLCTPRHSRVARYMAASGRVGLRLGRRWHHHPRLPHPQCGLAISVVTFTSGHIAFRQSLLVRTADAERLASHSDLTSEDRVGALIGTTGEFRLLELTGLVDANGALVCGYAH